MTSRIYVFLLLLVSCAIALGAADDPSLRIIGGSGASITNFPYLVSIRKNGQHHCGGAIISRNHILTAAHCIYGHIANPYYGITVVTGSDYLNQGGQSHQIRGAYTHSAFNPTTIKNDIGVLVLAGTIGFTNRQKPIPLPNRDFPDYASAVIAGFGRSIQFRQDLSPNLKALSITIVHASTCLSHGITGTTPGHLCGIQPEGQGTCQGDSGGPLVSNGQVVGIVSHGTSPIECAMTPDIYTDVYYYRDFVQYVMTNYY